MNRNLPQTSFVKTNLVPMVVGCVFVVGMIAFLTVPWAMRAHPGENVVMASPSTYHPS